MLNSLLEKWEFFVAILSALFFSYLYLIFSPMFLIKPVILYSLPVLIFMLVISVINPNLLLIIILFTRSLLDIYLTETRVNIFGLYSGVGAGINLIIIIFFTYYIFIRNPKAFHTIQLKFNWFIYLLICAIAIFYSPQKGDAIKLWFNLLTYAFIFFTPFLFVQTKRDMKYWLKVLIFSTILPVFFAYVDLVKGGRFYADTGIRIAGTFCHPNILAFYVVFTIALVFYIFKSNLFNLANIEKYALRIYMISLIIILLATKTRSAWISCWLFFFIYGLLKERKYIALAIILPALIILIPPVYDRVKDLFQNTSGDMESGLNSFAWRIAVWKSSLKEIKNGLIFGHGLASFTPFSVQIFPTRTGVASHNSLLQILFETGILGFLAFASIFVGIIKLFHKMIRKSINSFKSEYVIGIAFVLSYLVTCTGDNMLYYLSYNWYFWFFIGIMVKSLQVINE